MPPTVELDVEGDALPHGRVERLVMVVLHARDVADGHIGVSFVGAERIAELNREWRGKEGPTDVLSFPVDELGDVPPPTPRELGDVVICPEHTTDLEEAVVHGVLHLCGMDHETDAGEMLALQDELMAGLR